MSSILVVEKEERYRAQIQDALGAGGWRIRLFHETGPALQAASSERPDLVIVGADVPGVEVLASSYSRSAGGPGVLGLLPERATEAGVGGIEADDLLAKPFSGPELRTVVQRALSAQQRPAVPPAPPAHRGGVMLTSRDIFGDVLAEVEADVGAGEPAPTPAAAPAPAPVAAAPATSPPASARPPAPPPRPAPRDADDDINRRLEKTLTGVFGFGGEPKPRPAAPAPPAPKPAAQRRPDSGGEDVDALINKTLSKLDLGTRGRPAAAPAAASSTGAAGTRSAADAGLSELEEMTRSFRRPAAPAPAPASRTPAEAPVEAPVPVQAAMPVAAPVALPVEPEPEPEPLPGPEPVLEEPLALAEIPFVLEPELDLETEPAPAAEAAPEPLPRPAADPPSDELLFEAAPELPEVADWPPASPMPPMPSAPRSVTDDIAATQRIQIPPPGGVLEVPAEPQEQTFGQYTLLDKIAAGGMAEVWKARMRGVEGFQKTVAIKKILPHMTDNAEFVGMFIDEAKLAAQLSHPNIVHIYDLGKIGRDYYIAMEYVEGRDLRSLMNAGRRRGLQLPLELALLIAARIASALDYAHRKRDFEDRELGLVHRDVSPQNVLISYEGDVKLCDFGIAKAVSKAGQTQMGALKGKLQYMSPEQAWGRAVDFRSDLFSLGAVLFEMLTGERLFTGDSELSVLEAVRQGQIRPARQSNPEVPPEVEEIVARALAYEPQNRFASAGEMKQRLEAVLHALKLSPGPTDLAAYMEKVYADDAPSGEFSFAWPSLGAARDETAETSESAAPPPCEEPATFSLGPSAAAFAPEAAAEAPVEAVAPVGEVQVEETGGRQSRTLLYALIGLLLLVAIVTFWLLSRREAPPAEPAAASPAAAPAAAPSPVAAAQAAPPPTPAPRIDVEGLVSQEMARREAELRRKMEAEERRLRQELERVQAENRKRQAAAESAAEAAPEATPPPAPPPGL